MRHCSAVLKIATLEKTSLSGAQESQAPCQSWEHEPVGLSNYRAFRAEADGSALLLLCPKPLAFVPPVYL